ncbi:hypothetical protein C4S77_07255 [Apibacter adventoris]|uniref:DUF306 domain-containing protein n=2 Tax=Apibacter adventoris TaxID=1679466 RepID=A0A2S8AAS6_9FLAO|nr:hypothetical protein C4S77_07255 [Apibacter adventoris]
MRQYLFKSHFLLLHLFLLPLLINCKSAKMQKQEKVMATKTPNSSNHKINKILVYLGDNNEEKWQLVTINDQNALDLYTHVPVMRFDESWKQIYGLAECNKFTAYYKRDSTQLSITRLSSTDQVCSNTNESMFLDVLQNINEISEDVNLLYLLNNGKVMLTFKKN